MRSSTLTSTIAPSSGLSRFVSCVGELVERDRLAAEREVGDAAVARERGFGAARGAASPAAVEFAAPTPIAGRAELPEQREVLDARLGRDRPGRSRWPMSGSIVGPRLAGHGAEDVRRDAELGRGVAGAGLAVGAEREVRARRRWRC